MYSAEISEKNYRLIGVSAGCSWKELRKSYKLQIQKFHPDRYEENSILKFDAEEHIKSLNIAYQYFQTFYKEYGGLPRITDTPSEDPVEIDTPHTDRSFTFKPEDTQEFIKTPLKKRNKLYPLYMGGVIVSSFITLAYLITPPTIDKKNYSAKANSNDSSYNASIKNKKHTVQNNLDKNKKKGSHLDFQTSRSTQSSHADNDSHFSYGSTMGNVIDAQGIPDSSNNGIWYYGKSSVHFENGLVKNWRIHNDTPLNTTISIETENRRNLVQ